MMGLRMLTCCAVSMTAHFAAAAMLFVPDPVQVAGGATSSVRLGNSFVDVAGGAVVALPKLETVQPVAAPAAAGLMVPTVAATRLTATEPVAVIRARPPPPVDPPQAVAALPERRGVADGAEAAKATVPTTEAGNSAEAGNAAATNYPGAVMRKISRTRKPRVGMRGTAIVGFEVAGNGGLAGVQVLQSSGAAEIDAAAVEHLRRAAPFPPPPAGAERRFQVAYDSR